MEATAAGTAPSHDRVPASRLLLEFANHQENERIALGDLLAWLDDRAFGILMLVLAFPNIFPNPILGLSGMLGVPLAFVAMQLAVGRHRPWLPRAVLERSVARTALLQAVRRLTPALARIERLLRPRWTPVSGWTGERLVAGLCVVLAVALALPIPFGNTLPALAISVIALGMVERDGLAILVGVALGLASLAVVAGVVVALGKTALFFVRDTFA